MIAVDFNWIASAAHNTAHLPQDGHDEWRKCLCDVAVKLREIESSQDILREISATEPTLFDEATLESTCIFCETVTPFENKGAKDHSPKCPWLRARNLVGAEG